MFFKILHSKSHSYLFNLIPENNNPFASRSALNNQISFFNAKTDFFLNFFFPAVVNEWSNLDVSICNSSLCHLFKKLILKFIRPEPNRISATENFEGGLKFLTRMRLGLSHLADHRFRHNFQDCLNPIYSCGQEIEQQAISFFTISITVVQENFFLKKLTWLILIFYSRVSYL